MRIEHLVYSTAIAIFLYAIFKNKCGSWIIILSSYSPDVDVIVDKIFKKIGLTILVYGEPIKHGDFHNILILFTYAILVALLLNIINIKLKDSFTFASIGFGAHLLEDALVFNPGYRFLWPISEKIYGIGIMEYNYDLYGIATKDVLVTGLILVVISIMFKMLYERREKYKNVNIDKI